MVPDLGSLCGLFWGGGAQVCADSRAHIPVKLRSASGIIAQWLSTLVFESWSFC